MHGKVCGGVGSSRHRRLRTAVLEGHEVAPMDIRYITARHSRPPSEIRMQIHKFIKQLYDRVAEPLPEDGDDDTEDTRDADPYAVTTLAVDVEPPQASLVAMPDGKRYLPPGSIFELWRQFCDMGWKCGYRAFREEFHTFGLLKFRTKRQHSICATCVQYKLLIKMFSGDVLKRQQQTKLYHQHLDAQYADREIGRDLEAASETHRDVIVISIDAVDQAKFAWPRSPAMKSKAFDSTARPRLHVTGLICHGRFRMIFVSDADAKSDSNMTCELLAFAISKLHSCHVAVHSFRLVIRMDNTSKNNKNNPVARFAAFVVAQKIVRQCDFVFLRTGHTHDGLDQWLGRICRWIWHREHLHTPMAFVSCLNEFVQATSYPHEPWGYCYNVDLARDWTSWLLHLQVCMTGIGGPSAPHTFTFMLRSGPVQLQI